MLIPSCANSIGGSPYSLSNQHAAPLVFEENHSASRTLTTNQPSVTGARPDPVSSSRASATNPILAARVLWFGQAWGLPLVGTPGSEARAARSFLSRRLR